MSRLPSHCEQRWRSWRLRSFRRQMRVGPSRVPVAESPAQALRGEWRAPAFHRACTASNSGRGRAQVRAPRQCRLHATVSGARWQCMAAASSVWTQWLALSRFRSSSCLAHCPSRRLAPLHPQPADDGRCDRQSGHVRGPRCHGHPSPQGKRVRWRRGHVWGRGLCTWRGLHRRQQPSRLQGRPDRPAVQRERDHAGRHHGPVWRR